MLPPVAKFVVELMLKRVSSRGRLFWRIVAFLWCIDDCLMAVYGCGSAVPWGTGYVGDYCFDWYDYEGWSKGCWMAFDHELVL